MKRGAQTSAHPTKKAKVNEDVAAIRVKTTAQRARVKAAHPADCVALAKLIATPRSLSNAFEKGAWSSAQHLGVLRSIFARGVGLARISRLTAAAPSASLAFAIHEVANTKNVMRAVLRWATPYCTPTRAERRAICASCHVSDDTAALSRWFSRGVDPNTIDVNGDTAPLNKSAPLLLVAARQGHVELIDALLRRGADVNLPKANGATPLYLAAQEGHLAAASKLLEAGANVNQARYTVGATPLYVAAQMGHAAVVDALILAGAEVDKALATTGRSPLYIAAARGRTALVVKLLAAGANVNKARTDVGSTSLWIAAQEGHTLVVETLLQHGADLSIRGFRERTPLEAAQFMNHPDAVALLVRFAFTVYERTLFCC